MHAISYSRSYVSRHICRNVRFITTIFTTQIATSTQLRSYCGNEQEWHTVSTKTHLQLPGLISRISHFKITTSRSILDFIRNLTTIINPETSPITFYFDVARIWPSCQILMLLKQHTISNKRDILYPGIHINIKNLNSITLLSHYFH